MKSIIIYYSYTGNTKKIANILGEILNQKGELELIELRPLDESNKFFIQATRAFRRKRAEIESVNFDLKNFDLICFGTPVWAFSPAPAMNTYLDRCSGLENKSVILFVTYGSGAGVQRCLNYMEKILSRKGVKDFKRFSIQEKRIEDKDFVTLKIKEVLGWKG